MPYWFDGNNLIGRSATAAREDPRLCKAFLASLSACHKSGGGRFLVYFDGDDPGSTALPHGIAVRYSAPLSTDQAILRRLGEIQYPSEVIVVTNDRELTVRCRGEGASALSWREFAARMESRRSPRRSGKALPEKVDVEDWMRYFGLDKTNL
jgi:predicted RNA-binding protein with PIN domain